MTDEPAGLALGRETEMENMTHKILEDVEALQSMWSEARAETDANHLRKTREQRRASALGRVLPKAERWRPRPGVGFASVFAIRLGALVKALQHLGHWPIQLPSGKMAAQAQWMLDEAAEAHPGWRGRIARRFGALVEAAEHAGLIGLDPTDERAWRPVDLPPRDHITYFRGTDTTGLWADIRAAVGLDRVNTVADHSESVSFDSPDSGVPDDQGPTECASTATGDRAEESAERTIDSVSVSPATVDGPQVEIGATHIKFTFQGRQVELPMTRGVRMIAETISRKGELADANDLDRIAPPAQADAERDRPDEQSGGADVAAIDSQTEHLLDALREIREGLAEARSRGDESEQARLERAIESIQAQFEGHATSRTAKAQTVRGRRRDRVRMAWIRGIDSVAEVHPLLSEHIKESVVRSGGTYRYAPDPDMIWLVGR